MYNINSDEQKSIHYFVWYVSNNIYYLINVKSFYLSTLTSRLFRETFLKAFYRLIPWHQKQHKNTNLSSSCVNNHSISHNVNFNNFKNTLELLL